MKRVLVLALLLTLAAAASAHEVRPAYLGVQQLDGETYDVLWRVPVRGTLRLRIDVKLPEVCQKAGEAPAWQQGGMVVERWTTRCRGGLTGGEIAIEGLEATLTDALFRYERLDGTTQVERLTPTRTTVTVTDAEGWQQVAGTYTALGVEHILLGIDHLLFVLALLIIVPNLRTMVFMITSFTVAHSLTLAAATMGFVAVPQAPVEAVIALSILFVAVEIVHWKQGKEGITRRKPWIVAFLFGLLHGFGFAGALSEIGLPEHAIPLALLFFNVGVELGQLLFVAAVLLVWAVLRKAALPAWAWRMPTYAIGALAAYWTIERVAGF
jgi:hydrogenase/urease accessory protein HupE